jgi:serine protease Do
MPDRPAQRTWPHDWGKGLVPALVALALLLPVMASASELRQTPVVKAVQRVRSSVVNIRGEKTVPPLPTQATGTDSPRRVNGMGTGVIIDPRGYILTNYHVVDGVRQIQVTLADKRGFAATLVARDLETDLAIIKISASQELPVIAIGTSSDLMPGETAIAVGNAFGYEHTVTEGIVSALHRAVQVSDAQFYDDLIQTSASINPGNSGGPLLNIDGEMIGINVAVRAGALGIGFAIPVDRAVNVAASLLGSCDTNKAWHGVVPAPDVPASLSGMKVAAIDKKSPAAECGIRPGDLVTAVGDAEIKRALDFQRAMLDRKAGEKLDLVVQRDGKPLTLSIMLGQVPETARPAASPAWELLGMELKSMTPADFRQKFQTRYRGGLVVADVRPNSPASEQGIRPGDVLVGMHIWETVSLDNVAYILKRPDFGSINPVKFFILRGNETLYGYMPVSTAVAKKGLDR